MPNKETIVLQTLKPVKIIKWKVEEGMIIYDGRIILLYEEDNNGKQGKLKSKSVGAITKLFVKEGDTVEPGNPLYEIDVGCSHPTVINDLCAECGADLQRDGQAEAEATIPMVHSIPELKVSHELAQKLGRADTERLLKERKLVLLVDLDQTLIHTTHDNIPNNLRGVHHFQLLGMSWYHTRLRPGTERFLKRMSNLFELHICTFGIRPYAHTVAHILDPDAHLFSNRILSRDECFDFYSKHANLHALFPCGDELVCIIDDREDVWNYSPNLIPVKPYYFFKYTGDIMVNCHQIQHSNGLQNASLPPPPSGTPPPQHHVLPGSNPQLQGTQTSPQSFFAKGVMLRFPKKIKILNLSERKEGEKVNGGSSEEDDEKSFEPPKIDDEKDEEEPSSTEKMEKSALSTEEGMESKDEKIEEEEEKGDEGDKDKGIVVDFQEALTPTREAEAVLKEGKELEKNVNTNEIKEREEGKSIKRIVAKKRSKLDERRDQKSEKEKGKEEKEESVHPISTESSDSNFPTEWIEVEEEDDYLHYLEDILIRVHKTFYKVYEKKLEGEPTVRWVINYLRKRVLSGCILAFSGVIPVGEEMGESEAGKVALRLGAELSSDPTLPGVTHLVAASHSTAKVAATRKSTNKPFIVSPSWLLECSHRWEKVDERLFPVGLKEFVPFNPLRKSNCEGRKRKAPPEGSNREKEGERDGSKRLSGGNEEEDNEIEEEGVEAILSRKVMFAMQEEAALLDSSESGSEVTEREGDVILSESDEEGQEGREEELEDGDEEEEDWSLMASRLERGLDGGNEESPYCGVDFDVEDDI